MDFCVQRKPRWIVLMVTDNFKTTKSRRTWTGRHDTLKENILIIHQLTHVQKKSFSPLLAETQTFSIKLLFYCYDLNRNTQCYESFVFSLQTVVWTECRILSLMWNRSWVRLVTSNFALSKCSTSTVWDVICDVWPQPGSTWTRPAEILSDFHLRPRAWGKASRH